MQLTEGGGAFLNDIEMGVGTWAWGDRLIWGFGSGYGEAEVAEAYSTSRQAGIRFFDTAEIYGQGVSERLLGKLAREDAGSILIASKFLPFPWRLTRSALKKGLAGSLKRLGVEKIDLYQMHWPYPPVPIESWMDAMAEAVREGSVGAVGVSNYDREQTERAAGRLASYGLTLASNQVEYNLLSREIETNGVLRYCQENGIRVIAYSPLAMGILTGKYTPENLPAGIRFRRYSRRLLEQIQPLIRLMLKIGSDHGGKTPAQVAINWVIRKGAIPIPGSKNLVQAEQNAGAIGWRLDSKEVEALDELSTRILAQ